MFTNLVLSAICLFAAVHIGMTGPIHFDEPVSGEWNVSLKVPGGQAEGTMKLKLKGTTVTGTVESAHTGPGTIKNGLWKDGKLTFTAEFAKHESIAFTGKPSDGKLEGEFQTEGNTGQWTASRPQKSAN